VQFLIQNQLCRFVRAVGYRWLAKWLFGYMGWENTRPLPACLYHELRSRYGSTHVQGYVLDKKEEIRHNSYAFTNMYL
jgi:hypothetical protein